MSANTTLRRLSAIISDAVDKIEEQSANAGHPYPSLNEPFDPTNPSEALTVDPVVLQNAMLLIAAANQLIATVRLPATTVFDMSLGVCITARGHLLKSLSDWIYSSFSRLRCRQ